MLVGSVSPRLAPFKRAEPRREARILASGPVMPGYSTTPLDQKLGVKPGLRVAVIGAPADFALAGVRPFRRLASQLDVIVCFVRSEAELRRRLARLEAALAPTGSLWIAWPKRASGVPTDLGEHRLRALTLPAGLVDALSCGN